MSTASSANTFLYTPCAYRGMMSLELYCIAAAEEWDVRATTAKDECDDGKKVGTGSEDCLAERGGGVGHVGWVAGWVVSVPV